MTLSFLLLGNEVVQASSSTGSNFGAPPRPAAVTFQQQALMVRVVQSGPLWDHPQVRSHTPNFSPPHRPNGDQPQAPPSGWLSQTISTVINRDRIIDELTLTTLNDNKLALINDYIEHEVVLTTEIGERASDQNTSGFVIIEKAQDRILGHHHEADLMMLSVPLVDTTKIGDRFGLDGFTDDFKNRLLRILTTEAHMEAGLIGGRILLLEVDPNKHADIIHKAVEAAKQESKDAYISRLRGTDIVEFQKAIDHLPFFASQAPAYLPTAPNTNPLPPINQTLILEATLKAGMPSKPTSSQWNAMDNAARRKYVDDYDLYLSQRRHKLALAASYWLSRGNRANASFFTELLLEDAFQKLNERLELVEKTPESLLRQEVVSALSDAPAARQPIPMMPDAVVRSLTERLYQRGDDVISDLYEQLQQGRAKAVPLWNFHSNRMPRLIHNLPSWTSKVGTGTALIDAAKRLGQGKTSENLSAFQEAYRAYRMDMLKSMILSYRDPRLQEIHKLEWIDEVVQADESGELANIKAHVAKLAAAHQDHSKETQLILQLLEPGVFLIKRPIGDEVAFLLKSDKGEYWMGFTELNKGNAYFAANPPDQQDSTYHKILLGYLEAAGRYVGTANPLDVLGEVNRIIAEIAPQRFESTEKVPGESGAIERMQALVRNNEPASAPTYARSRGQAVWKRKTDDRSKWVPDDNPPTDLVPYKTQLSATRMRGSQPVVAGRIRTTFDEMDRLIAVPKGDIELINRVVETKDMQAMKNGMAAESRSLSDPSRRELLQQSGVAIIGSVLWGTSAKAQPLVQNQSPVPATPPRSPRFVASQQALRDKLGAYQQTIRREFDKENRDFILPARFSRDGKSLISINRDPRYDPYGTLPQRRVYNFEQLFEQVWQTLEPPGSNQPASILPDYIKRQSEPAFRKALFILSVYDPMSYAYLETNNISLKMSDSSGMRGFTGGSRYFRGAGTPSIYMSRRFANSPFFAAQILAHEGVHARELPKGFWSLYATSLIEIRELIFWPLGILPGEEQTAFEVSDQFMVKVLGIRLPEMDATGYAAQRVISLLFSLAAWAPIVIGAMIARWRMNRVRQMQLDSRIEAQLEQSV